MWKYGNVEMWFCEKSENVVSWKSDFLEMYVEIWQYGNVVSWKSGNVEMWFRFSKITIVGAENLFSFPANRKCYVVMSKNRCG